MLAERASHLLSRDLLKRFRGKLAAADRGIGKDVGRQPDTAGELFRVPDGLSEPFHEMFERMDFMLLPAHSGTHDLTCGRQRLAAVTLTQGWTTVAGAKPLEKQRPTHRIERGLQAD